jgi:hypothetical protein
MVKPPKPTKRFKPITETPITKRETTFTVADFLADVQLIQAGKKPQHLGVGLANSEYQTFLDEEEKERLARKAKVQKSEMDMAFRVAQDL